MMDQYLELLHKLVQDFGVESQKRKLDEELEELQWVLQNPSKHKHTYLRNLTDEFADVLILIYQIIIHYGMEHVVDTMIEHKIQRTLFEKEKNNE